MNEQRYVTLRCLIFLSDFMDWCYFLGAVPIGIDFLFLIQFVCCRVTESYGVMQKRSVIPCDGFQF